MSSYLNQINYDNFLQSAMAQTAQVENVQDIQESMFAQSQQAYNSLKASQQENKDMGMETLLLISPEAVQKTAQLAVKAKQIYSKLSDLKDQSSKVIDGLKTLPDDLKAKYTDKINEIQTMIKEGSDTAIKKATDTYNNLIDTANKTKGVVTEQFNKISSDATDSINRAVSSTTSITSDLQNNLSKTASNLKSQFSNLKSQGMAASEELAPEKALSSASELLNNIQYEGTLKLGNIMSDVQSKAMTTMKSLTPLKEAEIGKSSIPSNYEQLSERARMIKIPVSVKAPAEELVNKYKSSQQQISNIQNELKLETDPMKIQNLTSNLNAAKTSSRMNERLMQLDTVNTTTEGSSLFSKLGEIGAGATNILGIGATGLMTLEEAKGQIKSPLNLVQTTQMQAELGGTITQKGAQVISSLKSTTEGIAEQGKSVVQAGLGEAKQSVTQAVQQTQKLAGDSMQQIGEAKTGIQSTISEGMEAGKSALSSAADVAGEVASKGSSVLESVAEKGILETLGEVSGITAIPVVGEIASAAVLGYGIYEGIKDLFGGHSSSESKPTPPPILPTISPASLVRQAGI